ncbi:MAG: PQQ-dependent sugar dehydrogenase [Anaerolineales bacterium]
MVANRLVRVLGMFATLLSLGITIHPTTAARPTAVTWPQIMLTEVIPGLDQPVHVTHAGDGSGRLFVVERAGYIRIIRSGMLLSTPFLDIASRVDDSYSEEGLLSIAFPPGFGSSPSLKHFYVYYVSDVTGSRGDLVIARYQVSAGNLDQADVNSEQVILTIPHPSNENHDGGQLAFGPNDGYLYIGPGDGGGGGDPGENAQDPAELLGKLLRIDVETGNPLTYTIPATNPYTQTVGYRGEIWALGLRNPWRFSFDRQTGDLYLGDVGQGSWEEIDFQPAASGGGQNYGWDCYEGSEAYELTNCGAPGNYTFPIHEYANNHSTTCAVVGGFVYRGTLYFQMQGIYFFSDNCGGQIWGLQHDGLAWQSTELLNSPYNISSFGEDEAGNLYAADLSGGGIYRIDSLERHLYLPFVRR